MAAKDVASKSALEEVSEPIEDRQKSNLDAALSNSNDGKTPPPLAAKLFAVALIACISFGSHWSSGVTGAMKSTIKKVAQAIHQINRPFYLPLCRKWTSTTSNFPSWKPAKTSWLPSSCCLVVWLQIALEVLVRSISVDYLRVNV